MLIVNILKRFLKDFKFKIRNYWELALIEQKYPTCEFYPDAKITNTSFEDFNVINTNVTLDSCSVGSHTYIQKNTTIFNAEIGRFCSIATGVSIGPGIHKIDGISTHPAFYLKNTPLKKTFSGEDTYNASRRTIIGNDVWIGEGAIILDGIQIGNGAIIAAGSVVIKNVAPYSIVGGVPARLIRLRFVTEIVKQINDSKWWLNSEKWMEQNYSIFADTSKFLNNLNNL